MPAHHRVPLSRLANTVALVAVLGAAAVLLPSPAQARIIRAESVMPPGQSGFVSVTGIADGTGSPHLYDQHDLFEDFDWKPAKFDQPGVARARAPA